ncbi:proteophosphoglycan [Salix suchowensis]|nr:proteophosphoglycan [Salix suchowensis]
MATLMIQDGMKLRGVTLDALTTALCAEASASRGIRTLPSRLRQGPLPYVHPLVLSPAALRNGCLSDALRLMQKAESYRQRRSSNMFERLIEACLLQGEILVGSLLFVLLVKDWERRRNVALRLASARSQEHELPEDLVAEHVFMHSENLTPTPRLLNRIMRSVDSTLSQECIDSETIQPALQALANITNLLDDRRLPLASISSLSVLCIDVRVLTTRNGGPPRQVNAYKYFHATLKRLISDLPTKPLNSIRFDPNPAMAGRVLRHMTEQRHKPLSLTYRHTMSSSDPELSCGIIRWLNVSWRCFDTRKETQTMASWSYSIPTYVAKKVASRRPVLKTLCSSQRELKLPSMPPPTSLLADERTLCAYILHLVATGRPGSVTQILFHVLPGLAAVDHLAGAPSEANTTRAVLQKLRDGAALGPYIFTSILHALRKDGRTGLAERVWLYAKKAERTSWDTAKPWCLPTAAYTIMIQCYGDEAKRRRKLIPKRTDKVLGWARFARRARVHYEGDRAAMGLHMGLFLFRSMKDAAADVYKQLMKLPNSPDVSQTQMEHPQPDARFFNAALRLCTIRRSGRMRARSPTHYRRRHRFATYWLARLGHRHPQWTPALQEVCEAMVSAGYSVPIGLRYILIGRWPEENGSVNSRRQTVDRQPYACPRQCRRWHPLRLHTTKTRGLPLGRNIMQIAR